MTNGEKLKEVFPSIELYEKSHDAIQINFDSVWWNAEYKEPTTKNNLGVDCISRADAIKAMQDKAKKLKNEDTINGLCGAVAILFDMPSVTPQEPIIDKIRAEINNLTVYYTTKDKGINLISQNAVNRILDKYKAEVEPQESEDKE